MQKDYSHLPPWLKIRLGSGTVFGQTRAIIHNRGLHTVCQAARCPNRAECYGAGTATFLLLGDHCTRSCRFCAISEGLPALPDANEPKLVAEAASAMNLKYAVVTSVTRDDLADGGAGHFAATVSALRASLPGVRIELLIPDLKGDKGSLGILFASRPDVLNHNLETVPRLYPEVRPSADYKRSLDVLQQAADYPLVAKSGLMLGLGETPAELESVFSDLRAVGCAVLTLGQYLQPTKSHLPVIRYVEPDEFDQIAEQARSMGFRRVVAGPLVRSSYHAHELFE